MRTGKLSISRGHQIETEPAPRLALVGSDPVRAPDPAPVPPPPPPLAADYHQVHDRLTALERLTRLFEQGALSADEFAAEKAIILGLPADELVLRTAAPVSFVPAYPREPRPAPSLMGRLLGWKVLVAGLGAGLALSFAAQPDQTIRFFDEALRLFGI